jgi:hypothetical protein
MLNTLAQLCIADWLDEQPRRQRSQA